MKITTIASSLFFAGLLVGVGCATGTTVTDPPEAGPSTTCGAGSQTCNGTCTVIARDPEVVWLQTSAGPGFIEAEDALRTATEANEGLAAVTGVANKAYVVVPYTTAGTLSVHNAEAVLEFATKLQAAVGG